MALEDCRRLRNSSELCASSRPYSILTPNVLLSSASSLAPSPTPLSSLFSRTMLLVSADGAYDTDSGVERCNQTGN